VLGNQFDCSSPGHAPQRVSCGRHRSLSDGLRTDLHLVSRDVPQHFSESRHFRLGSNSALAGRAELVRSALDLRRQLARQSPGRRPPRCLDAERCSRPSGDPEAADRRLPVRRWISVALVRRSECAPKTCGSTPMLAIHFDTSRASCLVVMLRSGPCRPLNMNSPGFLPAALR
jgi:hypothetical protein